MIHSLLQTTIVSYLDFLNLEITTQPFIEVLIVSKLQFQLNPSRGSLVIVREKTYTYR